MKDLFFKVVLSSCVVALCGLLNGIGADENDNAIEDLGETTVKTDPTTNNYDIAPEELVCPAKEKTRPLFSFPCKATKDCTFLGKTNLCCGNRCVQGAKPAEPQHEPLFGLVERVCPKDPLPEIFEIKKCKTDQECAPRICCPEKMRDGKFVGYCRTAEPIWERLPGARTFAEPLKAIVSYMQCTPPPPPILDLFPKTCNNPLDCFPNLCCQERGKKFCRPPRRSLLTLVADIGQRLVPTETARKFIERIS